MKHFIIILCALQLVGCQQQQRYFPESDETKIVLESISAYENGDWEAWRSHFADTAKIYVNSNDHISVEARMTELSEATQGWSEYGFDKEEQYVEMVLDKEDETWVYFWGSHEGSIKATGTELSIPVHLAVQFVDGKIVEEHVFYDGTDLNAEMTKAANMTDMEAKMRISINSVVEAWNENDPAKFISASDTNILRTANGEVIATNQVEYAELMKTFHTAFPDFTVEIDKMDIVANKAHIYWTCTGTNNGEFLGNEATGKSIKTKGHSIWHFNIDGKATQEDAFFDNASLYTQLGYTELPNPTD